MVDIGMICSHLCTCMDKG